MTLRLVLVSVPEPRLDREDPLPQIERERDPLVEPRDVGRRLLVEGADLAAKTVHLAPQAGNLALHRLELRRDEILHRLLDGLVDVGGHTNWIAEGRHDDNATSSAR